MVSVIKPVVWSNIILLTVVINHAAEDSVRIELTVRSDESLILRNVIHLIAHTTVATVGEECLVGHEMSILRSVAIAFVVVAESRVVNLVVLSRLCDVVVALESLGVETPFHVNAHHCISKLRLLCGDHDDTVGTTGTVKCV